MNGFKTSCRIKTNAAGDWVISPPAGVRLYIEGDTRIHENLSYHLRPDINGRNITTEQSFISRVSAEDNNWRAIAWSPELGLFAAVSNTGTNDRVMTSPDGINWTIRVTPADNNWYGITWSAELGLFAAVSISGTNDRVMTSPDGINWTIRVTPADNNWFAVAWSPELGLFAAISTSGTDDRVMISPNGIDWTIGVTPVDNNWVAIAWSPELGLFAAVAITGTDDRVMTSPDGINWTIRVSPVDNSWEGIAWSPELGLFAAVSASGTDDRVMTSACGRCRIQQNAIDDWQILPPAGQITQIGDGLGGFAPPITNNDLLVIGTMGAFGIVAAGAGFQAEADSEDTGAIAFTGISNVDGETASMRMRSEEITIAVGNGLAGVVSVGNLFQPSIIVLMVYARVTQAPGGGATTFRITPTGTPGDCLIHDKAVAVDGVFDSTKDSDGDHDGPWYNPTNVTLTIATDADVTISDMKVRVGIHYIQLWNFDS